MHISWLGQTCVKIQTKNINVDSTIVINAYKPKKGSFPRYFSPEIALFSSGMDNTATLSQNPFVISTLGEFEMQGIVIYSLPDDENNRIFKLVSEGMTIVHLGKLNKNIENSRLEKIMNPDILFIPVGGRPNYLERKMAASLATAIEPRIIIPIGFKCDTDPDSKPISMFVDEAGLKPENQTKKIIIKKKDLPADETKLIVLDKE
ncbi:MAG: MBL fold metallo-hydrolase [bacterium]